MSLSISIPKTGEQIPLDGLMTLARTAFGLGIGMLVADKVRRPFRQATAIALVSVGALAMVRAGIPGSEPHAQRSDPTINTAIDGCFHPLKLLQLSRQQPVPVQL